MSRRHSYQIYQTTKEPVRKTLINKKMFVVVDNDHKLVSHKDGHLLIFHRARDAKSWIFNNMKGDKGWRILKLEVDITKL